MSKFQKNYSKWLKQCHRELEEKGYDPEECAVWESGKVHWKGSLVISDAGFVTPWKESKYYVKPNWRKKCKN